MLNFEFNDEQNMLRTMIREFCSNEIAPHIQEIEEKKRIPDRIIKSLADVGILGMTFTKEYGGVDADPIIAGIVAEEVARADISCAIPTFFLVPAAWGKILDLYGTEVAKQSILPKVTTGRAFCGIGATEADVGSDLANMRTMAKKEGDRYIVNGEKMYISGIREVSQQLPEGGSYITLTRTDRSKGTRGMSLLLIPFDQIEDVDITLFEDWGRVGLSSGGFALRDVEVPKEYLIGKENKGFYTAMEGFDYARAIIALVCCSVGLRSLEYAMDYLKLRETFGTPIGKYQGVQFKLAEHWTKLEAQRWLAYRALWLLAKEQKKEGRVNRFEVTKACAQSKLFAPQMAFEAINDAIQWHGAFGYTIECPLELALKGVRSYYWAEGALEVMRMIVARELLGKDFVAYR